MGELVQVRTKLIRPMEDELFPTFLDYVLSHYVFNQQQKLNPPAVRAHEDGYFVLDGHHRLVIADLHGVESIDVYVAEHSHDILKPEQVPSISEDALDSTNSTIDNNFDVAIRFANKLEEMGLRTFTDLRNKYPYLRSLDALKDYFGYGQRDLSEPLSFPSGRMLIFEE
ncbi:MAG: ParB-like nuclease domain-containing protein [Nanoarchaeota archaeon]|nr:ParB-like nuclease domain-containing protein [Nanoarchaeota archaeon]